MARINLLPWRAARRKQREREFFMLLGASLVAAVLVFLGAMLFMDSRIDNQQARNHYLEGENKLLDAKIVKIDKLDKEKARLLARKQIIEQLQANRSQMVHLFDELVKTIPDGARLSGLKQNGDTLTLEGHAQSNASVANYMRNLDASQWLSHADLKKSEAKGDDKKNRFLFGLDVKLRKAGTEQTEQDALGGAAPAKPTISPTVPAATPPSATPSVPATPPPAAAPPTKPATPVAGGKS
jgi:type IV pilus assembly protein PilN